MASVYARSDFKPVSYTHLTFKVTITGIDGTYSTNVAGKTITNGTETEFTLRHGETFVVKNLPENASYTVVETDKKGYQKTEVSVNKEANQTSDTAEGTIRMDGENTVDYTNTKTCLLYTSRCV